jgi:2-(1,2-epoxy-1,2-dihydrophenyl)acetyl-CoA isomerase
VNGTAAGIGSHLALACDLVIAADTARFIEVFIRSALLPDGGGAYLLTRLLGPHKTKELMFFGDEVPAAEAARIGLVNRVVPAAELASAAGEWARRLAGAPTVTLGLTKALVNRSLDVDRSVALREEAVSVELNMSSQDANAGLTAFRTRTAATYQGW